MFYTTHEVRIQRTMTKYKHTQTAFFDALNKILAENLFKVQEAQELNDPDKRNDNRNSDDWDETKRCN